MHIDVRTSQLKMTCRDSLSFERSVYSNTLLLLCRIVLRGKIQTNEIITFSIVYLLALQRMKKVSCSKFHHLSFVHWVHPTCSLNIICEYFIFIDELRLLQPEKYHYLNQSGCINDPSIDDKNDFFRVLVSFVV